jgi:signal transduction histidine kinase/DNA-binding response OmpR family regulator
LISEVHTTPFQERKHKGSILVLADESASLKLLLAILTEDDYAVHARQLDLESQLRFVKETLPDLVLVDVRKPGMDGYQVCAILKSDPTTRAIPVIFISSIDRLIYQASALVSGAVDYVTDPFDAEEVLWRIETHISLCRLRENLESAASNHGAQPVAPNEDLERAFHEIHVLSQATGRKHAEEKVRQAERDLRRREEFFAEAQRLSSTGSFLWRAATDQITWSAQMYRIYAISHAVPVTWKLIGSRIHPGDLPTFKERVRQARRDATDLGFEHRLRLPDQSVKYVQVVAHGIRNHDGQLEYIGAVQDVTERRLSEDALRELESDFAHMNRVSMMGELAASLAHEILHPIATARNNARAGMRFLEMNPPNLGEAREALSCVVRDADRAKDIVGRVRGHIKKAPPRREPFDLNEAIREALVMVRSAIAKNSIAVNTDLMDELVPVQGDRVQLQQVVVNLILNAVEAMSSDEKGARELSIRIEQGQADGGVLVQVRDSGPGIDPGNVERVFEPFYTTKIGGVGMGLSICRSIINGHGGRLWAEANEPRGAVFQFTLSPAQQGS